MCACVATNCRGRMRRNQYSNSVNSNTYLLRRFRLRRATGAQLCDWTRNSQTRTWNQICIQWHRHHCSCGNASSVQIQQVMGGHRQHRMSIGHVSSAMCHEVLLFGNQNGSGVTTFRTRKAAPESTIVDQNRLLATQERSYSAPPEASG